MDALKAASCENIKTMLDGGHINYNFDEKYNTINLYWPIENQVEEISISINFFDSGIHLVAVAEKLEIHPLAYRSLSEFLTRVNGYEFFRGYFSILSFEPLKVYYSYIIPYAELSDSAVEALKAISTILKKFEKYGDGIVDVLNGVKRPEEAYNDAIAGDKDNA